VHYSVVYSLSEQLREARNPFSGGSPYTYARSVWARSGDRCGRQHMNGRLSGGSGLYAPVLGNRLSTS